MNKTDEAHAALGQAIALEPSFTLADYRKRACYPNSRQLNMNLLNFAKLGLAEVLAHNKSV